MKIDYIARLFLLMISIVPQRFFLLLLCGAPLVALAFPLFFFGQGQLLVLIRVRDAELATNLIDHIHLKHPSKSLMYPLVLTRAEDGRPHADDVGPFLYRDLVIVCHTHR